MSETLFCNKCGAQSAGEAQFCIRCGTPMNPASPGVSPPISSPAGSYTAAVPSYASAGGYPAPVAVAGVHYGGFWIRVVAVVIDAVILRVVVAPVSMIFGGLGI